MSLLDNLKEGAKKFGVAALSSGPAKKVKQTVGEAVEDSKLIPSLMKASNPFGGNAAGSPKKDGK